MNISSDKIKWAVKDSKYTMRQLLKAVRVIPQTFYRQIRDGDVDDEIVKRICEKLKIKPEKLMSEERPVKQAKNKIQGSSERENELLRIINEQSKIIQSLTDKLQGN